MSLTKLKGKEIIDLYRKLLKYGKTLQLTDHDYYLRRIKTEFRAEVKSPEQLEFRYKRGLELLQTKRLV
ncbi:MIEF1 upstream open reading frame protein-like isoform X2 [Diaphorina citri]|uniref:MIEF1 upstream open reading frame protein-like isoform X2 n=1 Tax=Diaphorina citri TaxID=121845 RepID=A0A1S3DS65_DIACI|nr:MIEF1 upstream open reading frame protein-like isoform X2 [Diaphorina citri]